MPGDERLYKALRKQNNEYTLTVCGRDGKDETHRIGALKKLIWGMEAPKAVINKLADKDIRIITLTITEGGYNKEKATGEFIMDDTNIQHDQQNPLLSCLSFSLPHPPPSFSSKGKIR